MVHLIPPGSKYPLAKHTKQQKEPEMSSFEMTTHTHTSQCRPLSAHSHAPTKQATAYLEGTGSNMGPECQRLTSQHVEEHHAEEDGGDRAPRELQCRLRARAILDDPAGHICRPRNKAECVMCIRQVAPLKTTLPPLGAIKHTPSKSQICFFDPGKECITTM